MAINKNFVVKNGLEVSTDLIFADANTNKVGIASTAPRTELDVRGGIAATDLNITGVATIATLRATTGIVTNFDGVNLNVSGIGTFASIDINGGDLEVANLDATDINVTGVGTIANARITNLNATGISTLANVDINAGDIEVTSVRTSNLNATGVSTIASLSVTGSTFETLTVNQYTNLLGVTTIANATGTNLNFSGVGTLGTVQISSGIITATTGIVTYYGDGAYLQNLSAGIGIGTTGGLVGYGATFINFYGPGVSTALYDSSVGIATIYFEGGGGGATVSIGTEAPTSPTSGDLWYNNNEGRIFIYYDEVAEGIGSAQVWVDAAPFNVGIITALQNVTLSAGTVGAPSISFEGDSDTGFYSPASNQVGATVAGSQVARFNPGGVTVTGVVTATSFSGDGSGLTGVASTDNIITSTPAQFLNNVSVGAGITLVESTGQIQATSFVGDGSGLSGAGATLNDDTSTASNMYPVFSASTSGSLSTAKVSSTKLTYNPSTGTLTSTVVNSSSDENLKKDISTIGGALDKVKQLRGVDFTWKDNDTKGKGVIAQELQEIFPELVSNDSTGNLSVNYTGLIAVLIEAIKELSDK